MTQGTLTGKWDAYLAELREDAHLLLAWGYADVRLKLPSARDEYDLTGMLADAMEERINNPLTPDRFSMYSVHNERPINTRAERGKIGRNLIFRLSVVGFVPNHPIRSKRSDCGTMQKPAHRNPLDTTSVAMELVVSWQANMKKKAPRRRCLGAFRRIPLTFG